MSAFEQLNGILEAGQRAFRSSNDVRRAQSLLQDVADSAFAKARELATADDVARDQETTITIERLSNALRSVLDVGEWVFSPADGKELFTIHLAASTHEEFTKLMETL